MNRFLMASAVALGALLTVASPAFAAICTDGCGGGGGGGGGDPLYDFSFTGSDVENSVTYNYSATGSFEVLNGVITSFTGTQWINGVAYAINWISTAGGYAGNDNAHPYDVGGVSFTANGIQYNIYLNGSQLYELDNYTGINDGEGWALDYNEVEVPEPGTLGLLGAGLLGLAGLGFLRRPKGRLTTPA